MKDTCSLTLSGTGKIPTLRDKRGDLLMAFAEYGKGEVFAVTDPWLYNEYTDGRKLPADYDNFAAGKELVELLCCPSDGHGPRRASAAGRLQTGCAVAGFATQPSEG